jgi:hypothetical protein
MGRTIPSYRISTEIEKRKWKPSREATLVAMFIPVPYSFPVTVGLVILIVWLIHRRSRYVPYSSKV